MIWWECWTCFYLSYLSLCFWPLGVAALIIRRVPHLRTIGYVLAGTMGIYTVIVSLGLMMGTNPIAVTRTAGGLLSQVAAGAVGGFVFALITANSKDITKDITQGSV